MTLVPPDSSGEAASIEGATLDDPKQRLSAEGGGQRPGPPAIDDPRLAVSIAAGQLRNVALFLTRTVEVNRFRRGARQRQLLKSLDDSAVHVRLTAEALEHLCGAQDGPDDPDLAVVPEP